MKRIMFVILFVTIVNGVYSENWLSPDKFVHLTTSFTLSMWNYSYFTNQIDLNKSDSIILSISITLVLGVIKEISDMLRGKRDGPGFFSYKDMIFNMIGCAVFLGAVLTGTMPIHLI